MPPEPDATPQPPYAVTHGGLSEVDAWAGWPPTPREARTLPFLRGIREVVDIGVLALAMFLVVQFAVANYEVDGRSMEPTFHHGDRVIVNRLVYRFSEPRVGDVVVLHGNGQRDLLKRVVALGGQRVEIVGGRVLVDGVPLEEPYIAEPPEDYAEMLVPEGHVWVLGDNRNNSQDSRAFLAVPVERLVGRADLRYLPLDRWWIVDHLRQEASP